MKPQQLRRNLSLLALLGAQACGCTTGAGTRPDAAAPSWQSLFDGHSLGLWKPTLFGGEGPVEIEDGRMILDFGSPLTGVTWSGDFPTCDYEIRLDAARLSGSDFFCALTFPVGEEFCTLILGGWGGSLIGLSCIDQLDASENETTDYIAFENNRPYHIEVRVTGESIQARLDGALIIDQPISGRTLSVRTEVDLSRPLGIAAFTCRAALWGIGYRTLTGPEER